MARTTPTGGVSRIDHPDSSLIARARALIPELLRVTHTPGVSVAAAIGGELVWSEGFGLADLAERRPMTERSVMPVGSLSKLYTATAVLQLVERGRVDLYAPASHYLPDIAFVNPLGERDITLNDLLTFRSGLRTDSAPVALHRPASLQGYVAGELARGTRREYRARDYAAGEISLWAAPVGAAYHYSNLGVAILGLAVEHCNPEGLTFGAYLSEHVTRPLHMTSTMLAAAGEHTDQQAARSSDIASGYMRFGHTLIPSPRFICEASPAGAMLSTPQDQLQWLLAMLRNGEPVLRAASVATMLSPHASGGASPELKRTNGLLVERSANLGRADHYFGEVGAMPWGWWTEARAYPRLDFAIVASANKWDMLRWYNSPAESPIGLIADLIATELLNVQPSLDASVPARSWAWKASYLAGFCVVEHTNGLLGVLEGLTDEDCRRLADRAVDGQGGDEWEREGFLAGAGDAVACDLTPAGIRDFIRSPRFPIPPGELDGLALSLGRRGDLPLPMPFYARRSEPASALNSAGPFAPVAADRGASVA